LRSRIEAALDGKPVRLAKIEISSARATAESAAPISLDELEQMQPDDIFKRLYRERYDSDAPTEQMAAFAELLLPQEGGAR
jgi:exonuclease SbcD